jgi:hypothetical protein
MVNKNLCIGCAVFGVLMGGALIAVGVVLPGIAYTTYEQTIMGQLKYATDATSAAYKEWMKGGTGVATTTTTNGKTTTDANDGDPYDYWVQHVTNAADVIAKGAAPIIQDKGPYHFIKYNKKYDVSFSGDLISMASSGGYKYVASKSCAASSTNSRRAGPATCTDDTDVVTTINPAYVGLLNNPTLKAGGGEATLIPLLSTVAFGSGIYQVTPLLPGPLDPEAGLLTSFGIFAVTPGVIVGAYSATLTALVTAQGGDAAKGFGAFIAAVGDTSTDTNAALVGAPYLQMKNTKTAPLNGGTYNTLLDASVLQMLFDPAAATDNDAGGTKKKMYALGYGGTTKIVADSAIFGNVLKLLLLPTGPGNTKTVTEAQCAPIRTGIISTTGVVRYWTLVFYAIQAGTGMNPNVAACLDVATLGTIKTAIATETGGKFTATTGGVIDAIVTWLSMSLGAQKN